MHVKKGGRLSRTPETPFFARGEAEHRRSSGASFSVAKTTDQASWNGENKRIQQGLEKRQRATHTQPKGPKKKAPPDMKLRQQSLHACVSQQRPKQPRVDTKEPPSRRHSILTPGARMATRLFSTYKSRDNSLDARQGEGIREEGGTSRSVFVQQNNAKQQTRTLLRRIESQTTCLCHVPFISVRQMALRWVGVTSIHP